MSEGSFSFLQQIKGKLWREPVKKWKLTFGLHSMDVAFHNTYITLQLLITTHPYQLSHLEGKRAGLCYGSTRSRSISCQRKQHRRKVQLRLRKHKMSQSIECPVAEAKDVRSQPCLFTRWISLRPYCLLSLREGGYLQTAVLQCHRASEVTRCPIKLKDRSPRNKDQSYKNIQRPLHLMHLWVEAQTASNTTQSSKYSS